MRPSIFACVLLLATSSAIAAPLISHNPNDNSSPREIQPVEGEREHHDHDQYQKRDVAMDDLLTQRSDSVDVLTNAINQVLNGRSNNIFGRQNNGQGLNVTPVELLAAMLALSPTQNQAPNQNTST